MSAVGYRMAGGPAAAKAADALRREQERRDQWPFPWVYPPPESERRNPTGFIVMPAINVGVNVLVLRYPVPSGLQFELTKIMFAAIDQSGNIVAGPGDVLWTVNRDTPLTGFAPQGSPLADLQLVGFNFGSPTQGPIELPRSENFQPTSVISVYAQNNAAQAGAPNFLVAGLYGFQRKA